MNQKTNTDEKNLYIIGWICIGIISLILLAYRIWPKWFQMMFPACVFYRLTGWYCPGCGGTRAVLNLLRGNILKSFFYHPFVPYTVAIGGWFMLSHTIDRLFKGRTHMGLKYRDWSMWVALGLVGINFVAKNILLYLGGDVIALL